jgi:predicted kinase
MSPRSLPRADVHVKHQASRRKGQEVDLWWAVSTGNDRHRCQVVATGRPVLSMQVERTVGRTTGNGRQAPMGISGYGVLGQARPGHRQHGGMYALVTGPPASGKTYVSRLLADELDLPLLAKDTIKAALIERLGAKDVEASRRLGRAAVAALLAVANEVGYGVLDSVWIDHERSLQQLRRLPSPMVEVFCLCDVPLMERRYRERACERGPDNFDLQRTREELWPESSLVPVGGPWPLIEVDTSTDISAASVAKAVVEAAGRA